MHVAKLFSSFNRRTALLSGGTSSPWEFSDGIDAGVSVWVSPAAVDAMVAEAAKAGRRETGGILVGRYGVQGYAIDVVEATPRPKGSRSGWFWFRRASTGLCDLLDDRWRLGLHYLGEWHYHPRGAPTPSGRDIESMRKISVDEVYHCSSPLLVILGGNPQRHWSLSATLILDNVALRLMPKD